MDAAMLEISRSLQWERGLKYFRHPISGYFSSRSLQWERGLK